MVGVVLLSGPTRPCESMHGHAWMFLEKVMASIADNSRCVISDVGFRTALTNWWAFLLIFRLTHPPSRSRMSSCGRPLLYTQLWLAQKWETASWLCVVCPEHPQYKRRMNDWFITEKNTSNKTNPHTNCRTYLAHAENYCFAMCCILVRCAAEPVIRFDSVRVLSNNYNPGTENCPSKAKV